MTSKGTNVKGGVERGRRETMRGRGRMRTFWLQEAQCLGALAAKADEGRKPRETGKNRRKEQMGGSCANRKAP